MTEPAILALADGTIFEGVSIGASGRTIDGDSGTTAPVIVAPNNVAVGIKFSEIAECLFEECTFVEVPLRIGLDVMTGSDPGFHGGQKVEAATIEDHDPGTTAHVEEPLLRIR